MILTNFDSLSQTKPRVRPNQVAQADGNSRRLFNARESTSYLLDRNYLARTGTVAAALRRRSLAPVR